MADGAISHLGSSNHCPRRGARYAGARQPPRSTARGAGRSSLGRGRRLAGPAGARHPNFTLPYLVLRSQSVCRPRSDPHTAPLGNGRNRRSARCSFSPETVVAIFLVESTWPVPPRFRPPSVCSWARKSAPTRHVLSEDP